MGGGGEKKGLGRLKVTGMMITKLVTYIIFSAVIDLWTVAITLHSVNDLTLFFRTGLEGRGLKLAFKRTTAASSP